MTIWSTKPKMRRHSWTSRRCSAPLSPASTSRRCVIGRTGLTTPHGYNATGERTSETNPLGYTQTFAYNQAGELTGKTDYNGQVTQYSYNESGWKTGETWLNGQGQPIYQATYTYRAYALTLF
jgi:YD repeat-containing protein